MQNQEITLEQAKEEINDLLLIIDNTSRKLGEKDIRIAQLEVTVEKANKIIQQLQDGQSNLNAEMSE